MKLYVVALYGVAAIGGFAFASHMSAASEPSKKKDAVASKKMKNLVREGDIEGAMEAARQLLRDLRSVNWNPYKIPVERYRLPDQEYAENPAAREPLVPTFWAHHLKPELYGNVAFYSDLYVRQNLRVVPGIEASSNPEGFFIVGYKTGEVTKIPLNQVRMSPPDESGAMRPVFPGMESYNENLRKRYPES